VVVSIRSRILLVREVFYISRKTWQTVAKLQKGLILEAYCKQPTLFCLGSPCLFFIFSLEEKKKEAGDANTQIVSYTITNQPFFPFFFVLSCVLVFRDGRSVCLAYRGETEKSAK
jgi:hypothetical protein